MAKEKLPFSSILDEILSDREPNFKELGLAEARKSGDEVLDRTHSLIDEDFINELSEGASKHSPIPPSKSATLTNRLYDKEKAAPRLNAVTDNWHKDARRDEADYHSSYGDNSLVEEITYELESANKEGTVESKEISDGQIRKYIHELLNQGIAPSKVAAKLEKLAEVELFNHQMSTDYLQRNAGMMGLAYLEPNSWMDKQNPNYRHNAKEKGPGKCSQTSSQDCVRQHAAWKNAGIKPIARSVKQIPACKDCAYFKQSTGSKTCTLYGLPIVANTQELSQIVNNLTPGVPLKQKHAALVQIANRTDQHAQPFDAGKTAQTSIIKTADARVNNQALRSQPQAHKFYAHHVAKLHDRGVDLKTVYKWADGKFGSVDTSIAFRGFVQSLRKDAQGQIVITAGDLNFLNSIGIRNESFIIGTKCASCPTHFGHVAKVENERGAIRVGGEFTEQTPDSLRINAAQKKEKPVVFTASVVEKLHMAGHPMEKIYQGAARKVGSLVAKKAVTEFIESIKKKPIKVALSQIDCTFLKNKLGVHNPIIGASKCADCTYRKGMHCGLTGGTLLSYPGMDKLNKIAAAGAPKDGRAILSEYDLIHPVDGPVVPDGSKPLDIQTHGTFEIEIGE